MNLSVQLEHATLEVGNQEMFGSLSRMHQCRLGAELLKGALWVLAASRRTTNQQRALLAKRDHGSPGCSSEWSRQGRAALLPSAPPGGGNGCSAEPSTGLPSSGQTRSAGRALQRRWGLSTS